MTLDMYALSAIAIGASAIIVLSGLSLYWTLKDLLNGRFRR